MLAVGVILASTLPAAAAAPNTSIIAGPSGPIASRSATFRFRASVGQASFQCKLDSREWAPCVSPKKYSGLEQGAHKFQVRARRGGAVDPSPATRSFKVDTVKPNTTILSGPTGMTEDHSPSFTFSSTEPGTFMCRLTNHSFAPCSSPFVPADPLHDGTYTFEVKARDMAGNTDATPASRMFNVETPITQSLATAAAAAELYFPEQINLDVPASCGGSPEVDCENGLPLPPEDQLAVTSTLTKLELATSSRYDVTVTSDVSTLQSIAVSAFGADCELTLTSAHGSVPTWQITAALNFQTIPGGSALRIVPSDLSVDNLEDADISFSGEIPCSSGSFGSAMAEQIYLSTVQSQIEQIGIRLCAAPGPAYLGPCPEP